MNSDLFLVVALAVLIAMMFLNSRKRKKQMQELQDSLKAGVKVVLHSGITGKLVSVDGTRAVIETTPGTKLAILKGAIRGIDADAPATPVAKTAEKPAAKPAAKKPVAKKPAAKKPAAK